MSNSTPTMTITLRPRDDRRLRRGHLWIFSNEIASIDGNPAAGDRVVVQASHGGAVGSGIYNPHSLIAVRMTGGINEEIDSEWFRARINRALALRRQLYPQATTYRLLHSESDGVPGVIVDRFGAVCAVQIAALGMEQRREMLYDALMEIEGVTGIVERNDHPLRTLEGLPQNVGLARGDAPPQTISDGILQYTVDPLGGQKTGFFLDQRENRIAMRRYATGRRVLDLYTNVGGFALHASHAGASEVVAVDSSGEAIAALERNRALNSLPALQTHTADVSEALIDLADSGRRFDLVIADPPPFARSRKHVPAARRKYVEIFSAALRAVAGGGVAFLASCSHHIARETFFEIVRESLWRADRIATILEERGAAPDHPIHPLMPETAYLHAAVLAVQG